MTIAEIIGAVLASLGIAAVVFRVVRAAFRRDAMLERVAQWFPDDKPNGEVSLPAQVKKLHRCLDATRKDVNALKADVETLKTRKR